MAKPDQQEQKAIVDQLVQRAKTDASFRQEVQDDPVRTLQRAGLSDEAITEVLRDEGVDTSGYTKLKTKLKGDMDAARSCWWTCMTTSGCAITITTE